MKKGDKTTKAQASRSAAQPCSAMRPTDNEIDLEARQWAEEYATRCENTQITRQAIFAAGARWARGVAQLGWPNPSRQTSAAQKDG